MNSCHDSKQEFKCDLCHVTVQDMVSLRRHLDGRKHGKALKQTRLQSTPSLLPTNSTYETVDPTSKGDQLRSYKLEHRPYHALTSKNPCDSSSCVISLPDVASLVCEQSFISPACPPTTTPNSLDSVSSPAQKPHPVLVTPCEPTTTDKPSITTQKSYTSPIPVINQLTSADLAAQLATNSADDHGDFDSYNLPRSKRTPANQVHTCVICDKNCNSQDNYARHLQSQAHANAVKSAKVGARLALNLLWDALITRGRPPFIAEKLAEDRLECKELQAEFVHDADTQYLHKALQDSLCAVQDKSMWKRFLKAVEKGSTGLYDFARHDDDCDWYEEYDEFSGAFGT